MQFSQQDITWKQLSKGDHIFAVQTVELLKWDDSKAEFVPGVYRKAYSFGYRILNKQRVVIESSAIQTNASLDAEEALKWSLFFESLSDQNDEELSKHVDRFLCDAIISKVANKPKLSH